MERIDHRRAEPGTGAILGFACVRNEALRLPYFLDYHRALGVDQFVFVDNGSTDGTRELLLAREDTLVFHAPGSYAASRCGMDWVDELLARYGPGHWIATLEPDELLVYPGCESLGLAQLTRMLDARGVEAMKTLLVDMYSDRPIGETRYDAGQPFLEACSHFDADSYFGAGRDGLPTRGGPRHRLFWESPERPGNSPFLGNVPLVRWREGLAYTVGTHLIPSVKPGPLTGAKLHFKFLHDFPERAAEEAVRNEHWDNAAQYKAYRDVLADNRQLCAMYEGSVRYRDSMQLVEMGLMHLPEDWAGVASRGSTGQARAAG